LGAILTPEQAIKSRSISDLTFSPNGEYLACIVSDPPKGAAPESHTWLLDVPHIEFRQFTFSSKSESSPRWSPDGHTLAFLSNRDERMQIFLIRSDGGEASPLTSGKNAVSSFRWSPDRTQIAFLAPEPKSEADEKKEKDKDDAKVADRQQDLARLWVVDIGSKKTRQITRGNWSIEDFDWISVDRLLAVATDQPRVETWNTALFSVSVADGKITPFAQPSQPFGGLTVSPDRTQISYVAARNAGPMPYDLFLQSVRGGSSRDVTASLDRPVLGVNGRTMQQLHFPSGMASVPACIASLRRASLLQSTCLIRMAISQSRMTELLRLSLLGLIVFPSCGFSRKRAPQSRSVMCSKVGAELRLATPRCSGSRALTVPKLRPHS